jgi:NYN domain
MPSKPHTHLTTYAFIDSQNLNLGVSHSITHNGKTVYTGWPLDFAKFRRYLKDKFKVETAFLFIGNLPGNEGLYAYLQRVGYVVILKPTTSFKDSRGVVTVKGNVDTDIVLYAAAKEIANYDKAVIVSGDGDFLSLYEYLEGLGKLGRIVIPNKKRYSQLLTKYATHFDFVSVNKAKLEKRGA